MQATPYQVSLLKTRLAVVDDALWNPGSHSGGADIQLVYALMLAQVSNAVHHREAPQALSRCNA